MADSETVREDDVARRGLLHRANTASGSVGVPVGVAHHTDSPCSNQPRSPSFQIPRPRGGHTAAIAVPGDFRSKRRRLRLPFGVRSLYVAPDVYVGVGLFVAIACLGLLFYSFVVPVADRALLFASRFTDADGSPLALPDVWLKLPKNTTEFQRVADPSESFTIGKRWVTVVCIGVIRHALGPLRAVGWLVVGCSLASLALLLTADAGFEEQPSSTDDPEEAGAQRRRDEEAAQALMPTMPPGFGVEERANILQSCVNQVVYERQWIETVERDLHFCPVCHVRVRGFDHHCGVVGACVGRGTMPLFVVFLWTAFALLTSTIVGIPVLVLLAVSGHVTLSPMGTVILIILFDVGAVWLGGYASLLAGFYTGLGLAGDFSLGRRRRLQLDENDARARPSPLQPFRLCRYEISRWRCANLAEMMGALAELKLANC